MDSKLTDQTRVLMSFGAPIGGFEFAMQLRHDIYQKFGKKPDTDPAFCYLDAESLRADAKTKYKYDPKSDKYMMSNDEWHAYYESAMKKCGTMILLITKLWLTSKWCWQELDMLVSIAEKKKGNLKTIIVMWPDGATLLKSDKWQERQEGGKARTPKDLLQRLDKLQNSIYVRVSGSPAITDGTNTYAYSCSDAEAQTIKAAVVVS